MLITDLLDKYSSKQINLIKAINGDGEGFERFLDTVYEFKYKEYKNTCYTVSLSHKNYINIRIMMQSVMIKNKEVLKTINKIFRDSSISKFFLENNQKYMIISITPMDDSIEIKEYIPRIEKVIDILRQDTQSNTNNQVIQIINNELKKHNDRLNYLRANRTADKREPIKVQAYIEQLVNLKLLLGGK